MVDFFTPSLTMAQPEDQDEHPAPLPESTFGERFGAGVGATTQDTWTWFNRAADRMSQSNPEMAAPGFQFGTDLPQALHPVPAEPRADPKELQEKFPGVKGLDHPMPTYVAQSIADEDVRDKKRQGIMARYPGGLTGAATGLGADLLSGFLDPVQDAAFMVPVVGEARYAGWLARAGGWGERAAITMGVGGAQGLAGGGILAGGEFLGRHLTEDDPDMTLGDVAEQTLVTGLQGALFHGVTRFVPDIMGRRFREEAGDHTAETQDAAARAAASQMANEDPVEVRPFFDQKAPAEDAISRANGAPSQNRVRLDDEEAIARESTPEKVIEDGLADAESSVRDLETSEHLDDEDRAEIAELLPPEEDGKEVSRETKVAAPEGYEPPTPEAEAMAREFPKVPEPVVEPPPVEVPTEVERPIVPLTTHQPGAEDGAPAQAAATGEPMIQLAARVGEMIHANEPLTQKALLAEAERIYGGTLGSGHIPRDEFSDAIELGVNRYIADHPEAFTPVADQPQAIKTAEALENLKNTLPTQTVRAGEKEAFQQFSTPPDYAYAATWLADLKPEDSVLEPSAGTGSFVAHALNAKAAKVWANDLSERRGRMLHVLNPTAVFGENAEHVSAVLPRDVQPSVVLMNPPFSATQRMKGKKVLDTGVRHVEEAMRALRPGGRLVAIVGGGTKIETLAKAYDVKADLKVGGAIYRKYGTTFPTRLWVIDKVPPSGRPPVVAEVQSAPEIIRMLSDVRDQRPRAEQAGERLPQAGGGEPAAVGEVPAGGEPGALGSQPGNENAQPEVGQPAESGSGGEPAGLPAGGRPEEGVGVADVKPVGPERAGAGAGSSEPVEERPQPLGSGAGGAGDGVRSDGSGERVEPGLTPAPETVRATELSIEPERHDAPITDAIYEAYKPSRVKLEGAKGHPGPLVQSAAMASVDPPTVDYELAIPKKIITSGALSDAQLEAVLYAGHAHSDMLAAAGDEPERRRGFFIGDGTGVGKGREVAGIILDNWMHGRTKHVWVSEKSQLSNDARRDWAGLGRNKDEVIEHRKSKLGDPIKAKSGILFTTYDTLKSAQTIGEDKKKGASRLQQIADWVGPDFDGVIAFDEAHNLGNAIDTKGGRGLKKAAAKAIAGVELQKMLPNARVVYVSATGATEVENLAYADRLGLWGRGTAFSNREDFISKIGKGGVAAMELVARDMKAMGHYIARNLSYDGVEYDRVEHKLTNDQRQTYDKLAEAWQLVLNNFHAAMEQSGITGEEGKAKNSRAKSAILSQFWGGHQRFFNQVITSMQMPSVLKGVERDVKEGRQAVLQLVNTNEAAQERALEKARGEGEGDLEDLDMTPRDQLLQLVDRAYPTQRFEDYYDEDGRLRSRPVTDSQDNPVHDPELIAAKERLIDELGSVRVPDGPIEMLLNHFGADKVSEVTGRKQRVVRQPDEKGEVRNVIEKRSAQANIAEASDFQEGKKKILVFSEAGGTGRSYHADNGSGSAGARRSHYLVQAGWRADKAVQGFGRTHRTNQASAPLFHLVTTDLQGQKRFISSIARRLAQLGALTKGERRTGDQGLFGLRDNLESDESKIALRQLYEDIIGGKVPSIGLADFEQQLGLRLTDDNGVKLQEMPPVTQFLNRILSLRVDTQNAVFDELSKRIDDTLERAAAAGTLDSGVETYRADTIKKASEQVVYTDPRSGAETRHVQLEIGNALKPRTFEDVTSGRHTGGKKPEFFVRSERSGKVFAVSPTTSFTDKDGRIVDQYKLTDPLSYQFAPRERMNDEAYWTQIHDPEAARAAWDEQVAKLPAMSKEELHLITGAVLPIWDRLAGSPRVFRLQTDGGERMLGRVLPSDSVNSTLEALGAAGVKVTATPTEMVTRLNSGAHVTLVNGWRIKRSLVAGEQRLELIGPDFNHMEQLKHDGVFQERIDWKTRFFIPTGAKAAETLGRITKDHPVRDIGGGTKYQMPRARGFYSTLERGVDQIGPAKASSEQWSSTIDNLKGVKREEVEWSGVKDWLKEQEGPVSKTAVQEYLRENNVKVQEVEKGKDATTPEVEAKAKEFAKAGFGGDEWESLPATLRDDYINQAKRALGVEVNPPKYREHTLPGGANYRELLLTLPHNNELSGIPLAGFEQWLPQQPWYQSWKSRGGDMDEAHRIYNNWREREADRRGVGAFRSSHFDEPNVLAHIRFDDRTGPNGEKILHMAEVQSDWHQKGRREGYALPPEEVQKLRDVEARTHQHLLDIREKAIAKLTRGKYLSKTDALDAGDKQAFIAISKIEDTPEVMAALENFQTARTKLREASGAVPNAPFKQSWQELSMKRMLRYAAEHGYDKLTWDTGETQADRYDLSKQVDAITSEHLPNGEYKIDIIKDGKRVGNDILSRDKISDYVGKDLAKKIVEDHEANGPKPHTYSGLDLKVGGEGMKGFYDKILPAFLNKYAKKWGAKVGEEKLNQEPSGFVNQHFEGPELNSDLFREARARPEFNQLPATIQKQIIEARAALESGSARQMVERELSPRAAEFLGGKMVERPTEPIGTTVHSLDITPAMRESVMQGQPLFQHEAPRGWETAEGMDLPKGERTRIGDSSVTAYNSERSPSARWLASEVERVAQRIVPDAKLHIADALTAKGLGVGVDKPGIVHGAAHVDGMRSFIAVSLESPDAVGTARHEAVHYLRGTGLINAEEWSTLERAAQRGDWIGMHNIEDRYPAGDRELHLEEAIAEEFGMWHREPTIFPEPVQKIFRKMQQFFQQLGDRLRQLFGANATADDVFSRIESGEVGGREEPAEEEGASEPQTREQRPRSKKPLTPEEQEKMEAIEKRRRLTALQDIKKRADLMTNIDALHRNGIRLPKAIDALTRGISDAVPNARDSTAKEQNARQKDFLGYLTYRLDAVPGAMQAWRGRALTAEWVRELAELNKKQGKPGITKSGLALEIAKAVKGAQDLARYHLNRSGAWVGDYEGYISRTRHDAIKIDRAGYKTWRDFAMARLDQNRTFADILGDEDLDAKTKEEAIEKFMNGTWHALSTGVHLSSNFGVSKSKAFPTGRNLARAHSEERVLHWKDADAWREYQEKFGDPAVERGVMDGLWRSGRDAALISRWGSNPQANFDRMLRALRRAYRGDHEVIAQLNAAEPRLREEFGYLTGEGNRPGNNLAYRIRSTVMAWQDITKLPFVLFTHMSVGATKPFQLKYLGVGRWQAYTSVLRNMVKDNSPQGRAVLENLRANATGQARDIMSGYEAVDGVPGTVAKLRTLSMRLGGLPWMLGRQRAGSEWEISNFLGQRAGLEFDELPHHTQRALSIYGITPQDWDVLRAAPDHDQDSSGSVYLTPAAARRASNEAVDGVLGNKVEQARDNEHLNRMREDVRDRLSMKLAGFYADTADRSVVTPGIPERAFATQYAGKFLGPIVGQYKQWAMAAARQMWGQAIWGSSKGEAVKALAELVAVGAALGYARMVVTDALKGKEPRFFNSDPGHDAALVGAAMVQGGGLGIFGDYLFGEFDRYGHTLEENLAGPAIGDVSDLARVAYGFKNAEFKGSDHERQQAFHEATSNATRYLFNHLPIVNTFYVRAIANWLILDRLQEMSNPGYLHRYQQGVKKRTGQDFWLTGYAGKQ